MRKVIGIGETVLDIIFRDNTPIAAVPGGSTFNALISLGRSGVHTTFISETGNDRVGKNIIAFLEENGVCSDYVNVFPNSKSPLSLAFLNENNDAEYVFYKDHPHDQLDFLNPEVDVDDIVLFGSYYALNPVIRPQVQGFLEYARSRGAILYYDVNFRAAHCHEVMKLMPNLIENLEYADIVRGSHEDFQILYKKDNPDKVFRAEISFYSKNFIYTQGSRPVEVRSANGVNMQFEANPITPVSTIGAGDNFNAGFIYGMLKYGIKRDDIEHGLTEKQWEQLIPCAQMFSTECCKDIYNYVSIDFGKRMQER